MVMPLKRIKILISFSSLFFRKRKREGRREKVGEGGRERGREGEREREREREESTKKKLTNAHPTTHS